MDGGSTRDLVFFLLDQLVDMPRTLTPVFLAVECDAVDVEVFAAGGGLSFEDGLVPTDPDVPVVAI